MMVKDWRKKMFTYYPNFLIKNNKYFLSPMRGGGGTYYTSSPLTHRGFFTHDFTGL
jgi:hypothetical protein